MKEELVSFETAKLLKEKGFDEVWCNHIYCIGYNTIPEDNELLECDWRNNVKGQFHLALAPTQSLAQKWLREKHSIHVELYRNASGWGWILTTTNTGSTLLEINNDIFFDTYEEALEEGLKESLNLIE